MAELFLGPIIEMFIKGCYAYMRDQVIRQTGMETELNRLQENVTRIKAVVFSTEISDQHPDLNNCIWQLRDAIDEANDVLDGFMYTKLKEQQTRKVRSIKKLGEIVERALYMDPNLNRLVKVLRNLNQISSNINNYHSLLKTTEMVQQRELGERRETGSMTNDDLIDRGNYKKFVMNWLSKPSNEEHQTHTTTATSDRDISLLSIVGLAGVGKTLLLQHVFKDEMTEKFYPKMWISVSKIFDAKEVIAKMLQSLKMENPDLDSLDVLQNRLKVEIQKCQKHEGEANKFLLVLDDIWQEEKIEWDCVFTALAEGGLGGKILVTTRTDSIALMISKALKKRGETLRLGNLKKAYCLKLLKSFAFLTAEVNENDVPNLEYIAGDIVKGLSGSPMEARAIGEVLNDHADETSWRNILDDNLERMSGHLKKDVENGKKKILSILRFSYIFLPKQIQNCFTFCGIFPKGHIFDKEDIIRMWIALDFIPQPVVAEGQRDFHFVEVEGQRYFHVLAKNFLFSKSRIEHRECYKMHHLVHKLANSLSKDEYFRVVGNEQLLFIPDHARHLSVEISNPKELRKIWRFKKLHSLFLFYEENNDDLVDLLKKFFKASRSIRLLYIKAPNLKKIPKEIKYLIHLRYLKLDHPKVTQLPTSLNRLYHLKFKIYEE